MESLEWRFQTAASALEIPGAVVAASDATGSFYYAKAFGASSLKESETAKAIQLDNSFWMASCTKLMTAIAALQCVDRGQFTLDEDVTRLLPELKDIEILKGFEEGTETPILVKSTKKITLRHLLTHSSGIGYDIFNPLLMRWRASRGEVASFTEGTVTYRYKVPLLFEPGELYEYSPGPDWAGEMVARSNNMTLGGYMKKYMWDPLGIIDMTFHLEERPDMAQRMADMSERQGGVHPLFGVPREPNAPVAWTSNSVWALGMTDDSGGAGSYATAIDYQKILHSITAGDGQLLGKEMLDELFRPQLSAHAREHLMVLIQIKEIGQVQASGLPMGIQVDYAPGGMVILEDVDGRRRKGSINWAGLPNTFWWADRKTGVCGVYTSHVIPPGDPKSIGMFAEFEKAVYQKVNEMKKK